MQKADLLVLHAAELATLKGVAGPRAGRDMSDAAVIRDGAVAIGGGRILAVGQTSDLAKEFKAAKKIDAKGRLVTPGLVDPHTHLVFAGSRADEFEQRIQGKSYQEIAAAGGGILSTVDAVRKSSRKELVELARPRLRSMLEHGTTTAEVKSGYGLTTADELKSLEAVGELARLEKVDLIPTFMGAHELPREFAGRRREYVDLVVNEMIPAVAAKKLAAFCDVFCEVGVFSVDDARRILEAAATAGLRPKLHAEEFKASGGAELAVELRAASADHLMAVTDRGIRILKGSGTVAVLLPGTSFFLGGARYAPARQMIESGVAVGLGSDCNPGSCMTWNLQLVMTLACTQLKMTPAEALCAATINAAHACGAANEVGSLEPGKRADLVIWEAESVRALPYVFGVNQVKTVIKSGKLVEN